MRRTLTPDRRYPGARGQIAVGFVVIIGLLLVFINMTVNLGQMGQVRAAVSNSADAGALAGASWMASGENEAAAIAQKMWDSAGIVQAIYLIPFCPNKGLSYGVPLWNVVSFNNNLFFKPWADDVMDAAWNLGRREAFTATVNNMLIRYPCVALGDQALGDFVRDRQLDFETNPNVTNTGFDWTNCLAQTDPAYLIHFMEYEVQYPPSAPTLQMGAFRAPPIYFEYDPPVLGGAGHFSCSLRSVGILDGPNPFLGIFRLLAVTIPGAVDTTGRKQWDIDLNGLYPTINNLNIGDCGGVCGMHTGTLSTAALPGAIVGTSEGTVRVKVTHEVKNNSGTNDPLWGLPIWQTRFPTAGAAATARYTSPIVGTDPTQKNGVARLEDTNPW